METFFSFVGFMVSVICFAVGAGVTGFGACYAVKYVQKILKEAA